MKPLVAPADLSAIRRWNAPERLVERAPGGYSRLPIPGRRRRRVLAALGTLVLFALGFGVAAVMR